jgi:hypothetical protein
MRPRKLLTTAALATALVVAAAGAPASAGDRDVERRGSCSGRSDWKLKLSPEDGGIEVEFEVDQNVNGDTWRVVMRHDGNRFFRGRRTTRPPSGSFEARRVVNNHDGSDRFFARARNLSTDEVCRGRASI